MKCPQCGAENKEGKKFCVQCGTRLALRCPNCGAPCEEGERFCGECGTSLGAPPPSHPQAGGRAAPQPSPPPPKLEEMHAQMQRFIPPSLAERMHLAEKEIEGENRLVTALFADISGFTPMSQRLPTEAVVEKVNECFKAIVDAVYRYEGNVNRFIGDCALAFFGAPISHENAPERAILAALDMQKAVSQLELNISVGVNTGMMYFGPIGTSAHLEFSAYGPDINLAKRLQEAAKPGQILIGPGTYRLTRKAFDFNRLDALTLKGIKSPVPVYEVLHVKAHPEKLRGIEGLRARMIGREREFAELKDAADQWLAGSGQIVSIIGEAGIGKSRLVTELKAYLKSRQEGREEREGWKDGRVEQSAIHNPQSAILLEGRCVSIGQPISYWPFIDILRSYFGLSETDSEHDVARNVTEGVKALFQTSEGSQPSEGFKPSEGYMESILPFIGHLMSIRFENEMDDRLKFFTPEQIRHQTLMRLRDVFVTIAKSRPLLLIPISVSNATFQVLGDRC